MDITVGSVDMHLIGFILLSVYTQCYHAQTCIERKGLNFKG